MELPQSVQYLREVINKRPVAILLPGPSIAELEKQIERIGMLDICYATVNDFWIMEDKILSRIGKRLDIVMASAKECDVPTQRHIDFVSRPDKNCFITEKVSFHHSYEPFMKEHGDKVLLFHADRSESMLYFPTHKQPLNFMAQASFSVLLQLAIIGEAQYIGLFGADGGYLPNNPLYWGGWKSDSEVRLDYDTQVLNKVFKRLIKNTCEAYGLSYSVIFNASSESKYLAFPKIGYEGAIEFMKAHKVEE